MTAPPKMYGELASWWPLLSSPEDYAEEAAFYERLLLGACVRPPRTLLELGSGGGNNASHLKRRFEMTLVELSEGMLEVSRALNPECRHEQGDMRTVRIGQRFDAVFVHDAVGYMTAEADLRSVIETAALHCAPGGAALFCPDYLRETFRPGSDCGGTDGPERSLRFLEWARPARPGATTCEVDYVYVLREGGGPPRIEHETHVEGLFARDDWLAWLREAGFEPDVVPLEHSEVEPGTHEVFVARKPA